MDMPSLCFGPTRQIRRLRSYCNFLILLKLDLRIIDLIEVHVFVTFYKNILRFGHDHFWAPATSFDR